MVEGAGRLSDRLGAGSEGASGSGFTTLSPAQLRRGSGGATRTQATAGRLRDTEAATLANDSEDAGQRALFERLVTEGLQDSLASTDRAPGLAPTQSSRPASRAIETGADRTTSAEAHDEQSRRLSAPVAGSNRTLAEIRRDAFVAGRFEVPCDISGCFG